MALITHPIRHAKRTLVALSLALAGCRGALPAASPTPETISLRILADESSLPLLRDLLANFKSSTALIAWDVIPSDSAQILEWLSNGEVPYGLVSYLPDPTIVAEGGPLWATPIGQLGVAIVTHPSNPTTNLTLPQLKAILRGEIQNWTELGGPDLPVRVVARPDASAESALIKSLLLGNGQVTRTAVLAPTGESLIELISADPSTIGYISVGYLTDTVQTLSIDGILPVAETLTRQEYPLRSPIVAVGLSEPSAGYYRDFLAWSQSSEGQAIVQRLYGGLP